MKRHTVTQGDCVSSIAEENGWTLGNEVGYQVRDSVAYTVGSEQIEPGDGWPYDTILAELAKKPTMTPATLSKIIVKKYLAAYSTAEPVTQSAFDLTRSNAITMAIDQLAKLLMRNLSNPTVRAIVP